MSSPVASKHSALPLTEVLASEVAAILKFVSKEATSVAAILKLSWQPGRVYVTSFRPTQSWWGERNLQLTWHPPQGQAIIHTTVFNAIISEFGESLAQNNMAHGYP